jgi:hypothetical protein
MTEAKSKANLILACCQPNLSDNLQQDYDGASSNVQGRTRVQEQGGQMQCQVSGDGAECWDPCESMGPETHLQHWQGQIILRTETPRGGIRK